MNSMNKFITIESGVGDSNDIMLPMITEFLDSKGEEYIVTREPGGTDLGEKLREFVTTNDMDALPETLLIFASRAEHIEKVIKPALDEGKWVICDRFTDSTYAYQAFAKGVSESIVKSLQDIVQKKLMPSLTIVFDIPLEISQKKLNVLERKLDKFESSDDIFKEKVNLGFKNIVKKSPFRCKVINTSNDIELVKDDVITIMEDFYNKIKLI